MEILSLHYGRYVAPIAESREAEPRQKALVFKTPQLPSNILDWPRVLPLLKTYADSHPFMQVSEIPIPDPRILGANGELFRPLITGVCGSDRKIVKLDMEKSALLNLPNVPPENLAKHVRVIQRIFGWDENQRRILRGFPMGMKL